MYVVLVVTSLKLLLSTSAATSNDGIQTSKLQLQSCESTPLCAVSQPNNSIDAMSKLQCVNACLKSKSASNCVGVNYWQSEKTCDMFNYCPENLTTVADGCQFMMMTSYQASCVQKSPTNFRYAAVDPRVNCSFPFTYKGVLYDRCTSTIPVEDSCQYVGCLDRTRRQLRCSSPTDFVATTVSINVTVGAQVTMPTLSVFGWIVWMQRTGYSNNWALPWTAYKNGFGSAGVDFWLGLERVHQLTTATGAGYRLRIEVMQNSTGLWYSEEYSSFVVGDELSSKYQLNLTAGFVADMASGLYYANKMKFSTFDEDNDIWPSACSTVWGNDGGWWFRMCGSTLTAVAQKNSWFGIVSGSNQVYASRMLMKLNG